MSNTAKEVKDELKPEVSAESNSVVSNNDGKEIPALETLQLNNSNRNDADDKKEELDEDIKEEESAENECESEESVEITHIDVALLHQEPLYAEICSFFNIFSSLLAIKPVSFAKIEKIFCTFYDGEVDRELIDLHVMLMRKIYLKFARVEKWESALQKFCSTCPALEAESLQLARLGYADLELQTRLTILKALCESQFDYNVKFKENIFNTYQTNELRLVPIGSDKNGLSYFYQQDHELNIRVYSVEPDDMSDGTWALVAKSQEELLHLIDSLKSPDFGKKVEQKEDDEDIDEDQLLNENAKTIETANDKKSVDKPASKPAPSAVELSDAEMSSIAMSNKRCVLWDLFRDSAVLNQKKLAKDEKKKEKEAKASTSAKAADKAEESGEENNGELDAEILVAVEDEDRRVLPRRNAKSNAMTNLRALGALPKKSQRNTPPKKAVNEKEKANKLPSFVETLPNSSDDFDSEEDDEEEDEEANSSDDDFTLDGKPETSTSNVRAPVAKKKKKVVRRRAAGRPPAAALAPKGKAKQPDITFISSDEDEAEPEEELKERKKATEKTLCMNCRSSKRPDLLLLCDMCDDAWHTWCLKPQLWYVPDGDWFCPKCHHVMLIKNLCYAWIKLCEAIKSKEAEDKKKQVAADRLKREMEYIGISLNNIIPKNKASKATKSTSPSSDSDEKDDENSGMRKSKRRAMKKVLSNKMRRKIQEKYYGPIVTIAEGRSRRAVTKVDYNFHAYEEQLQEAMDMSGVSSTKEASPVCGLGRGKDMSTIYEAERKRQAEAEAQENGAVERLAGAQPPTKRKGKPAKKRPRLTDMDVDNASSDSEEYKEEEDEAVSEDPEPSEDEYLPREFQKTRQTRRGGLSKSDQEFIDDDSSSEYEISSRKRKNQKGGGRSKRGRRAKRRGRYSDSDDDESSDNASFCSDSSDSGRRGRRRKQPAVTKCKWPPKASTSEEDEEELEIPSDVSADEKTETGRPLRRAAVEMKKKVKAIENEFENVDDENEDEEEEKEDKTKDEKNKRLVGALTRPNRSRRVAESDEDNEPEFKLDDEDESEEEEDDSFEEDNNVNGNEEDKKNQVEKNNDKKANGKPPSEEKATTNKPKKVDKPVEKEPTKEELKRAKGKEAARPTIVSVPSTSEPAKETESESPVQSPKKSSPRKPRVPGGVRKQASSSSINSNVSSTAEVTTPTSLPTTSVPPTTSLPTASSASTSSSQPPQTFTTAPLQSIPTSFPSVSSTPILPQNVPPALQHSFHQLAQPPSSHPTIIGPPQSIYGGVPPPGVFYTMPQTGKVPPPPHAYLHHPPPPEYYAQYAQHPPTHFLYQPMQSFPPLPAHSTEQQMSIDPRTGQFVESDSLGHALAGAMNPEDL